MKKQFSLCLSAFLAIAFLMTALPLRVGAASSASEVITTDDSVIWTAEQLQNARLSDADIPEVLITESCTDERFGTSCACGGGRIFSCLSEKGWNMSKVRFCRTCAIQRPERKTAGQENQNGVHR